MKIFHFQHLTLTFEWSLSAIWSKSLITYLNLPHFSGANVDHNHQTPATCKKFEINIVGVGFGVRKITDVFNVVNAETPFPLGYIGPARICRCVVTFTSNTLRKRCFVVVCVRTVLPVIIIWVNISWEIIMGLRLRTITRVSKTIITRKWWLSWPLASIRARARRSEMERTVEV